VPILFHGAFAPEPTLFAARTHQPDDNEFQIGEMAANRGINYVEVIDRRLMDLKCVFKLNRLISINDIGIIHAHDDKSSLYGLFLKLLNCRKSHKFLKTH